MDRWMEEAELADYALEREDFLGHEVKYAKMLCENLDDHPDFKETILAYSCALEVFFHYLQQQRIILLDQEQRPSDRLAAWRRLEVFFPRIASLLNTGVLALLQRRKHRMPAVVSADSEHPRIRLSEVHLQYASAVRSLERISNEFHNKLAPIYHHFPCPAPVLILAGGYATAFHRPHLPYIESERKQASFVLTLSYVTMPRWVPNQIRYAALLAHEHAHRVLWPVRTCVEILRDLAAIAEEPRREGEQESLIKRVEDVGEVFGEQCGELALCWRDFSKALHGLFNERDWPRSAHGRKDDLDHRAILVAGHVDEFLADATAILLAGPAYLFSSLATLAGDHRSRVHGSHPPALLRLKVQVELLCILGFGDLVVDARRIIDGMWGGLRPRKQLIVYFEWLHSTGINHVLAYMESVCECIISGGYVPVDARAGKRSIDDWTARWDHIATKVTSGDILHDDSARIELSDILNAMWHNRIRHGVMGRDVERLAWRMATENG